ncbi:hypothetical protein SISNIDRAFT_420958, partial [Sistotremastrum niveocremeum HHB9708]
TISDVTSITEGIVLQRSKDFVGLRDYALYDSGALAIPAWTSATFKFRSMCASSIPLIPCIPNVSWKSNGPDEALRANTQVGHCWPTPGSTGRLGIALSHGVIISHLTIDHLPGELAPDISTAPRQFTLWGYHPIAPDDPEIEDGLVRLAQGEYDIGSGSHIQTFPIFEAAKDLNLSFVAVLLEVQSNWGSLDHTCIYRVRIHGTPI